MKIRGQAAVSLLIVAGAALAATAFTRRGAQDPAAATAGHVHGAPAAGDAAQPVRLSTEAARRIGVTYTTVARQVIQPSVRVVGTIAYDETRLHNVSPKIEGWVERLYVDFTGAPVAAGQALLELYSPMLVSAQEELLLARRLAAEAAGSGSERAAENARALLEAARRRLRYWDISAAEIARIEQSGAVQRTLTLRAPRGGIVVEKLVVEGARIMPGMDIYRLADLSRVWVEGEVFEKDLALVSVGQAAHVTLDAYPGERFHGRVQYVYPIVSAETRTGRIRVEIDNPGTRLKPGMYAGLEVESSVRAPALVIPREAVHFTGARALVFVRADDGSLQPREVVTGYTHGALVEVVSGLSEGEQVVSSANFLIDAESNMGAALGGMPAETGGSVSTEAGGAVVAPDPHAAHR